MAANFTLQGTAYPTEVRRSSASSTTGRVVKVTFTGGRTVPLPFELGGGKGNVVIGVQGEATAQVRKGWRLNTVGGRRVSGKTAGDAARNFHMGLPTGKKYTCTFLDPFYRQRPSTDLSGASHGPAVDGAAEAAARAAAEDRAAEEAEAAAARRLAQEAEAKKAAADAAAQAQADAAEAAAAQRRLAAEAQQRRDAEEQERLRLERELAAEAEEVQTAAAEATDVVPELSLPGRVSPPTARIATTGALVSLPPKCQLIDPQQSLLCTLAGPTAPPLAPPPIKPGPCDKCDGDHHADDCPHYPNPRDTHTDAWESFRQSHSVDADRHSDDGGKEDSKRARIRGTVRPQPGDGSCVYHSLVDGLGRAKIGATRPKISATTAEELRGEIAAYVRNNPTTLLCGTPVQDWVLWDSGLSCDDYASRMAVGHHWGGAIEIAVCAVLSHRAVCVYERKGQEAFECIAMFVPDRGGGDAEGDRGAVIRLVYGGRVHYDALVARGDET